MEKEEKPLFLKTLLIAAVILLANIGFIFWKYVDISKGFTGYAVSENITRIFTEMTLNTKLFLVGEWGLILVFLIGVFIRDILIRGKELSGIDIQKITGKSGTDLDTLYNILQEKKKLRISSIAKAFKINRETAMEWCKILESGNLASIDYPGVGEPIVKAVN